jgi:DNA-binding MarR family transcriptional regulator
MDEELDPGGVATSLLASVSVLVRRVRQMPTGSELSMPERQALSCLERSGPTTSAALAREVQITAQAMGATISALRTRGLIERRADPDDGRRVVLTVTEVGLQALKNKRNARTELIAQALTGGAFTPSELEQLAAAAPLLERLAQNI